MLSINFEQLILEYRGRRQNSISVARYFVNKKYKENDDLKVIVENWDTFITCLKNPEDKWLALDLAPYMVEIPSFVISVIYDFFSSASMTPRFYYSYSSIRNYLGNIEFEEKYLEKLNSTTSCESLIALVENYYHHLVSIRCDFILNEDGYLSLAPSGENEFSKFSASDDTNKALDDYNKLREYRYSIILSKIVQFMEEISKYEFLVLINALSKLIYQDPKYYPKSLRSYHTEVINFLEKHKTLFDSMYWNRKKYFLI